MKRCNVLRFFDIFLSLSSLILLFPIFLIVILLLLTTGERKVFYRQMRVGMRNKNFYLFKFVTMIENSALIGTGSLTMKDDPRILPCGKFLRMTKINELPQLLNILVGDMSIIGPRPLSEEAFKNYSPKVKNIISQIKPGLSGVGSIIFRNEERMLTKNISKIFFYTNIMPYKGELEIWFFYNQSLTLYFKLIFLTIFILFFPKSDYPFKFLDGLPLPDKDIRYFFT